MSRKIVFEPIAFEDDKQKKATQFTTTVGLMKDGKKIYPDEETGFMFQEFSTFAPAKFNPSDKRDWLNIPIHEDKKECVEFMNSVNEYDEAFEKQKDLIFGKFSKLYSQSKSVKEPKEEDELEMEANADKPKKQRFKNIKLKLKMGWNYYHDNEVLDYTNTNIIRKAVSDALAKNNDKKLIDDIIVTLKFTSEDGKKTEKKLKMSDIESRKEISTKVYFRKAENVDSNAKKVTDCNDEELEQIYGKPEQVSVKSPEDLDLYHKYNCWVRYLYGPSKVWAAKAKGDDGKRRTSLQFVCHQIDIVHIRTNTNSQSSVRSIYSGYGFGSKNNTTVFNVTNTVNTVNAIKDNKKSEEIKDESESEEESEEETKPVAKSTSTSTSTTTKTVATKQSLKVESESEEESEEEEVKPVTKSSTKTVATKQSLKVESESESEESEEDDEPEPEPPKKSSKSKTVVEDTKSKKAVIKKK
jgi:hypothetical protein